MSLWLPNWPVDRRRRCGASPGAERHVEAGFRPFALAASEAGRRLVTAVDDRAASSGIAPGMPLVDAQALRPDLAVAEADFAGDAEALARLARWCGRYSPWTVPCGNDGIWLDVTGCAHLRGGEENLVAETVARLVGKGIACRGAIADTAGAAWAVARFGTATSAVMVPGETRAALAALPVAALRLDAATASGLTRLGLRRVGDLYALPRPALVLRFGLGVAERLDQALGRLPEPLSPLPPLPAHWTRLSFAEPIVTPDSVRAATRDLLTALCRRLADAALGARRLVLTSYRVDGTAVPLSVGTARPSRMAAHLLHLLDERLAELDPGLGIEDMVLAATVAEPLQAAQLGLARAGRDAAGDEGELAALIDRLANRLGTAAQVRPQPRESHLPERAVQFVSPMPARRQDTGRWPTGLRPARLLLHPEPIEAMAPVPDDPPVFFRWRRCAHRVRHAEGPERIEGEWWRGATGLRDYYRVEDEAGRRFWLYRDGLYCPEAPPRWFLHGVFA